MWLEFRPEPGQHDTAERAAEPEPGQDDTAERAAEPEPGQHDTAENSFNPWVPVTAPVLSHQMNYYSLWVGYVIEPPRFFVVLPMPMGDARPRRFVYIGSGFATRIQAERSRYELELLGMPPLLIVTAATTVTQ